MMFKFPDGMHDGRNQPWGGASAHGPRFWSVLGVFLLSVVLGADLIWNLLTEGATFLCEYIAEQMESFFQARFGLDLYHAQMATAYTGAVILLLSALFGLRKLARWGSHVRADGEVWWRHHHAHLRLMLDRERDRALIWWKGLDLLNKSAVVIALFVMAVPVAVLLSYGLGMVVAEIL
ncbi:hypothetical protein [Methyloterricola oryzae]|uniref:hypothetical protein n=1 Tax=Methyloterricola oryzae TaxID=1495050 RepID=UPI0005EB3EC4|nr:hypothetical protein [Methyloterricola oryzae]